MDNSSSIRLSLAETAFVHLGGLMDIPSLSEPDRELLHRTRDFTDQVLVPLEDECESNARDRDRRDRGRPRLGVQRINHAEADGGRGHDLFTQMLIEVHPGRATGALRDVPSRPSVPPAAGTEVTTTASFSVKGE